MGLPYAAQWGNGEWISRTSQYPSCNAFNQEIKLVHMGNGLHKNRVEVQLREVVVTHELFAILVAVSREAQHQFIQIPESMGSRPINNQFRLLPTAVGLLPIASAKHNPPLVTCRACIPCTKRHWS